jgi:hypothetical protein
MIRRFLKFLDRHVAGLILFVATLSAMIAYVQIKYFHRLELMTNTERSERLGIYSTLTGVSAGLLGFLFTIIAILVAMPRGTSPHFIPARKQAVSALLGTSLIMGLLLGVSLIGVLADTGKHPSILIQIGIEASLIAGALGLSVGAFAIWALLREVD